MLEDEGDLFPTDAEEKEESGAASAFGVSMVTCAEGELSD